MSGNKVVLDTNVIIFASKGKVDFSLLAQNYEEFYVSIITYMEVYGYNFKNEDEKLLTEELFKNLNVVHINDAIAEQTIIYRKNTSKKIKLPDAIILATASYLEADLYTDDWYDFENRDENIKIYDIDDLKLP